MGLSSNISLTPKTFTTPMKRNRYTTYLTLAGFLTVSFQRTSEMPTQRGKTTTWYRFSHMSESSPVLPIISIFNILPPKLLRRLQFYRNEIIYTLNTQHGNQIHTKKEQQQNIAHYSSWLRLSSSIVEKHLRCTINLTSRLNTRPSDITTFAVRV